MVLGGLLWRQRTVDKIRRIHPFSSISVVLRRTPALDGNLLPLLPNWLIGVFFHQMLEVLNVFGRSGFEIGVA